MIQKINKLISLLLFITVFVLPVITGCSQADISGKESSSGETEDSGAEADSGNVTLSDETETAVTEVPETEISDPEASAKKYTLSMCDCDVIDGWWGESDLTVVKDGERSGCITANNASCVVLCKGLACDLSDYRAGGFALDVYIDDVSGMMTGDNTLGRIELWTGEWSSGKIVWWPIDELGLVNGWNTLMLPFDEMHDTGDLSNVTCFRLFQYVNTETVMGIDNMEAYTYSLPEIEACGVGFASDILSGLPERMSIAKNETVTLPGCGEIPAGYAFAGWDDGKAVYPEGSVYTVTEDVNFMAVINDGSSTESVNYKKSYERALLYEGSSEIKAALAGVIKKIIDGEDVTLVTLGDSITAGAAAASGNEWAALVHKWLASLNPSSQVTLVNAGIGSTEAVYGVCRFDRDVLAYSPDLIIIDFGTNDVSLPYAQEAYEGMICKALGAKIPVVNFNVCPRNGGNIQEKEYEINTVYGVPQISFKNAYYELSKSVNAPAGYEADSIWHSDNVHPTDHGHDFAAKLIISYLESIREDYVNGTLKAGVCTGKLPSPVTANGFADAILFENDSAENANISVTELDGWTDDYKAFIFQLANRGWKTSTEGASITFEIKGGYFTLFVMASGKTNNLEVKIDGKTVQTITNAYCASGSYSMPVNLLHDSAPQSHTVTLTMKTNDSASSAWFGICSVGVSNFGGK